MDAMDETDRGFTIPSPPCSTRIFALSDEIPEGPCRYDNLLDDLRAARPSAEFWEKYNEQLKQDRLIALLIAITEFEQMNSLKDAAMKMSASASADAVASLPSPRSTPPIATNNRTKRKLTLVEAQPRKKRAQEHVPTNRREGFGKVLNKFFVSPGTDPVVRLTRLEARMKLLGVRPDYLKNTYEKTRNWSEANWKCVQALFLICVPLMTAFDKVKDLKPEKRKYGPAMFQWLGKGNDASVVGTIGDVMSKKGFFNSEDPKYAQLYNSAHLAKLMHDIKTYECKETDGKGYWNGALGLIVPDIY
jgi:hypothetical protein